MDYKESEEIQFWARTFATLLFHRLIDITRHPEHLILPENRIPTEYKHNPCFDIEHVRQCTLSNYMAYELLNLSFHDLSPDWQVELTGMTYDSWMRWDSEWRVN